VPTKNLGAQRKDLSISKRLARGKRQEAKREKQTEKRGQGNGEKGNRGKVVAKAVVVFSLFPFCPVPPFPGFR